MRTCHSHYCESILLVDTTLREGQQHGLVRFKTEDVLGIARLLDTFGIDLIEVGHPAVSKRDMETAQAICSAGLCAGTLAHARANTGDVEIAVQSGAEWIGIFAGINAPSLEHRLHKSEAQVLDLIGQAVRLAKDLGASVRYTCEDASRTPIEDVTRAFRVAIDAGADRVSYADTVGTMTPSTMGRVMTELTGEFGDIVHVHCHNDFGLAAANSLAAFEAGAVAIDVSVDGIGERCGIASLAEVACCLRQLYAVDKKWQLAVLPELSRSLRSAVGTNAIDTQPLTGRYSFAHKAGLHIAAESETATAYEALSPAALGEERKYILSPLLGSRALRAALACNDSTLSGDTFRRLLQCFKDRQHQHILHQREMV